MRETLKLTSISVIMVLIITSVLPYGDILPQAIGAPITFGNTTPGGGGDIILDRIRGTVFVGPGVAGQLFEAQSITAYIAMNTQSKKMKAAIYDAVTGTLVGATEEVQVPCIPSGSCDYIPQWVTFNFPDPKPLLIGGGTLYILAAWSESSSGSADLYWTSQTGAVTVYINKIYDGNFPAVAAGPTYDMNKLSSIYATIVEITPPDFGTGPTGEDVNTITAIECTNFDVNIWIKNILSGWWMTGFAFKIYYDPTLMEVDGYEINDNGWASFTGPIIDEVKGEILFEGFGGEFSEDAQWLTITFHCLGPGTSDIEIVSEGINFASIEITNGDDIIITEPETFTINCNQMPKAPVGGVVGSVNKLAVLTPYIALAGLIVGVSSVYIIKKRKD